MSKKQFETFLENEIEAAKQFDAKKEVAEYQEFLTQLYSQARQYVEPYVANGAMSIEMAKKAMHEEGLGVYEVEEMVLRISTTKYVRLVPKGTNLIGTKGRVDMQGRGPDVRLLLVDKTASKPRIRVTQSFVRAGQPASAPAPVAPESIDWTWKIATSPPDVRYIDLNEETFLDAVLRVAANG
jgi:hypothetical protein